jgi:hypothetical protein
MNTYEYRGWTIVTHRGYDQETIPATPIFISYATFPGLGRTVGTASRHEHKARQAIQSVVDRIEDQVARYEARQPQAEEAQR